MIHVFLSTCTCRTRMYSTSVPTPPSVPVQLHVLFILPVEVKDSSLVHRLVVGIDHYFSIRVTNINIIL